MYVKIMIKSEAGKPCPPEGDGRECVFYAINQPQVQSRVE